MAVSVPPIDHPKLGAVGCEVTHPGDSSARVPHFHTYIGPDGSEARVYVDESGTVGVSEMLWHTVMTTKFGATLVPEDSPGAESRMGSPAPDEEALREDEN